MFTQRLQAGFSSKSLICMNGLLTVSLFFFSNLRFPVLPPASSERSDRWHWSQGHRGKERGHGPHRFCRSQGISRPGRVAGPTRPTRIPWETSEWTPPRTPPLNRLSWKPEMLSERRAMSCLGWGSQLSVCVDCVSGCKSAGILNHRRSLFSLFVFFCPKSKCDVVLQGKSPSDEHLLKLCTDVLRSKCLFEFMSFHVEPERESLELSQALLLTVVS